MEKRSRVGKEPERCVDEQYRAGNGSHSSRQPIQAIQPVDGVDHSHNPEQGKGHGEPKWEDDLVAGQRVVKILDKEQKDDGDGGGGGVDEILPARRNVPTVVGQAEQENEHAAGQQADEADDLIRVKTWNGEPLREQRSGGERQVQRQAAGARDESGVLTPTAGRVRQPQLSPDDPRQRRGDEGEGEGEKEDEDKVHEGRPLTADG